MKDKTIIVITAIIVIAGLEVYALSQGINGLALAGAVAIVAALAGFRAGRKL